MKGKTHVVIAVACVVGTMAVLLFLQSLALQIPAVGLTPHLASAETSEQTSSPEQQSVSPNPRTVDEAFAAIESEFPGFSGYFYDEEGRLNIFFTEPQQVDSEQVSSRLVSAGYIENEDTANGVILLQSKYPWKTLHTWKNTLNVLFLNKDLGITTLDANEKMQRIDIGVESLTPAIRDSITEVLIQNGIPTEDVQLMETGPILLESHGVSVSPRKGGVELGFGTSSVCTNGFIVNNSSGARQSVTAGHCEVVVDTAGDEVYRNPGASGSTTVGTETANTNLAGPRYSDSLMWTPASGITTSLGKICKNTGCSTDFTITGTKSFPAVGEAICKYGRSTHETCGTITATDVNVTHPNYSQLWAQTQASYSSSGGDSGSPVYKKGTDPNVTLYGLHWGVTQSGVRLFSPFNGITADQGTLTVK